MKMKIMKMEKGNVRNRSDCSNNEPIEFCLLFFLSPCSFFFLQIEKRVMDVNEETSSSKQRKRRRRRSSSSVTMFNCFSFSIRRFFFKDRHRHRHHHRHRRDRSSSRKRHHHRRSRSRSRSPKRVEKVRPTSNVEDERKRIQIETLERLRTMAGKSRNSKRNFRFERRVFFSKRNVGFVSIDDR